MNLIPANQNEPEHLKELAAQRELYSEAKGILVWQMILTIGLAVAFSILGILTKGRWIEPWIEKGAAFLSMLIALLDMLLLEPRQKQLAQQAARVQENFDCDLFALEWNELKLEVRPEQELVNEKAEKHRGVDSDFAKLKNWYSNSVGEVPLSVARLLCQRANIRWDKTLRRRYATVVSFGLPSLFVGLTLFGMWYGMALTDFVFKTFIPFLPAFQWGIRETKKQQEAARTLDRLYAEIQRLWGKTLKGELTDDQLQLASRNLQNEIYDHRRSAPFIFDWIYNRYKSKDDEQMNVNTESLVKDYLKRKGQE
ncbi:MAG: hypothetical protein HYR56_21240 [Acidobacteria bacterium]|nr:hypothetical protein [Acidobacteriota bacterium]MBI3427571.1 hypothetical protein [Acidobacteriota bacterium]